MKRLKYILFSLVMAVSLSGCLSHEELEYEGSAPSLGGGVISFKVPTMDVVEHETRAVGAGEYTINNGYLFVFDATSKLCTSFAQLDTDASTGDIKWSEESNKFTISSTDVGVTYNNGDKIVCVFNYDSSKSVNVANGITVDQLNEIFPLDADYIAKVQTDMNEATYSLGMPMAVNDFEASHTAEYHEVYRALARLEVFLDNVDTDVTNTSHTHEFTTDNVSYAVINDVKQGTICPTSSVFTLDEQYGEVVLPDDPTDYTNHLTAVTDNLDTTAGTSTNKVYLYPYNYSTKFVRGTSLSETTYSSNRFALLLHHTAAPGHNHGAQYYKLNLVDRTNNTYYDIKRNHDYRVVITQVHSHGYDSVQEAYDAPPSNIDYLIYDDQADVTLSNGQYAISMDEVVNYQQVDIYGHQSVDVRFDNISYVIPDEMKGGIVDMADITNNITVSYDTTEGSGLTVDLKNPFGADSSNATKYEEIGELTLDPQDVVFTVSGEGSCKIGLKIKLGNLEIGSGDITINKHGAGGDGALDAHPVQLRYTDERYYVEGSWHSDSPDADFGARAGTPYDKTVMNDPVTVGPNASSDKSVNTVIYMGHNATPIGYNTMDGSYTSASSEDSYPIFAEKERTGYYTYTKVPVTAENKETVEYITTKIMVTQLKPYYLGHFGGHAESGPHYYRALVSERIEEIYGGVNALDDDKPTAITGGVMKWAESTGLFYTLEKYDNVTNRYTNLVEGRDMSKKIVADDTNKEAEAVRYCYMKNDINGDGEIDPAKEPIKWYVPAQNQLLSMWISKYQYDNAEVPSHGLSVGTGNEYVFYWSLSEYDPNAAWNSPPTNYSAVRTLNMLEGDSQAFTKDGSQDKLAHIRCVRGVEYSDIK